MAVSYAGGKMPVPAATESNKKVIEIGILATNSGRISEWASDISRDRKEAPISILEFVDPRGSVRTFYRFQNANGDLGGFVESTAWERMSPTAYIGSGVVAMHRSSITDNAVVFGAVTLSGEARVSGHAKVNGSGMIYLTGKSYVTDNANLRGTITMSDHTSASGWAHLDGTGNGIVLKDRAFVLGNAHVYNEVSMSDDSSAAGNADLRDKVKLMGDSKVDGGAHVYRDAILWNTIADENCQIAENTTLLNCIVSGDAHVYDAELESLSLSGSIWVFSIGHSEAFSKAWEVIKVQKATLAGDTEGPNVRAGVKERISGDLGPSTSVEPGRAIFSSRAQIEEYLKDTNQKWPKLEVVADLPGARE